MTRTTIALGALWLALTAGSALAETQAPVLPAQRGAVFITKDDFAKALAARAGGQGPGVVGAVRAGDDRINVDVLRRDTPDPSQLTHDVVTEIYYILEGGGDFATGGTLVDPRPMMTDGQPTNPASIGPSQSSTKATGGMVRHVSAGDVVMLPPNVAHGFVKLDGHVTYMVVRVNPGYEKGR
ncbi:MAG TPA: hypothetical protein VMU59_02025 [Caulobacteraceae bacterium]|nr:hypothetical protein [Caulobacteraceae bacterium]